jgi:hypothetical protein
MQRYPPEANWGLVGPLAPTEKFRGHIDLSQSTAVRNATEENARRSTVAGIIEATERAAGRH